MQYDGTSFFIDKIDYFSVKKKETKILVLSLLLIFYVFNVKNWNKFYCNFYVFYVVKKYVMNELTNIL